MSNVDSNLHLRSPRLVLLRALNRLSLQYSSNYIRGDEIRRLGIGKKSAETKSDGLEMAKNPDDAIFEGSNMAKGGKMRQSHSILFTERHELKKIVKDRRDIEIVRSFVKINSI